MTLYYIDRQGDYLEVDHSRASREWSRRIGQPDMRPATATAILGETGSLCGTSVSRQWLHKCRRVAFAKMPRKWRRAFERYNRPMEDSP